MILDPATAAFATGVPKRTIQRWVLQGRVVDHGDGMRILVDPDEIIELQEMRSAGKNRLPKLTIVA